MRAFPVLRKVTQIQCPPPKATPKMYDIRSCEYGCYPDLQYILDQIRSKPNQVMQYLAVQHKVSFEAIHAAVQHLCSFTYNATYSHPVQWHLSIRQIFLISMKDHLWAKREILRLQRRFRKSKGRTNEFLEQDELAIPPKRRRSPRLRKTSARKYESEMVDETDMCITIPTNKDGSVPKNPPCEVVPGIHQH